MPKLKLDPMIIVTIGPSTIKKPILKQLKSRGVSYIRLNLSHTKTDDIQSQLRKMKAAEIPIIIDTEGSQVRTGYLGQDHIVFLEGRRIKIYDYQVPCTDTQVYLRPSQALTFLEPGNLISIDFQSVLLKVIDTTMLSQQHYIETEVLIGGVFGNNKAVTFDTEVKLSPFSEKDLAAINIAKKLKIRHFTLSFMDLAEEVNQFRQLYPQAYLFAKIETRKGLEHYPEILKASDAILIDRGDLSREILGERIPFAQKIIIRKANEVHKPVVVATNILESMCEQLKPMKSEINDVINTLLDGANGFVLTKESAIGKHPVETINTLNSIINFTLASSHNNHDLTDGNELTRLIDQPLLGALVEPHGGKLVNRFQVTSFSEKQLALMPSIRIDDEVAMDLDQLGVGAYSPLQGFMTSRMLQSVLDHMKLPNGLPWTMPILLSIVSKEKTLLKLHQHAKLVSEADGQVYGTIKIEDIFSPDMKEVCTKWFGTLDSQHPGVNRVMSGSKYFVGGMINLLKRRHSPHRQHELAPAQTRTIFQERGWSIVVGFHTRNAIHRSHEFIQLEGMKQVHADGIFIHPVVGKKKAGDFEADIIIKAYELMMKKYYPKGKVFFAVYPTYSRYAGPREAIFTAICRKNYGCSHFIVGRDHTGVGSYYQPWASHEIFKKFPDLGIIPIFFQKVAYSPAKKKYVIVSDTDNQDVQHISGTQARQMLLSNTQPPSWFMRTEISALILHEKLSGSPVFVKK